MRKRKKGSGRNYADKRGTRPILKDTLGEPSVNNLFAYCHSGYKRKKCKALNGVTREELQCYQQKIALSILKDVMRVDLC